MAYIKGIFQMLLRDSLADTPFPMATNWKMVGNPFSHLSAPVQAGAHVTVCVVFCKFFTYSHGFFPPSSPRNIGLHLP